MIHSTTIALNGIPRTRSRAVYLFQVNLEVEEKYVNSFQLKIK